MPLETSTSDTYSAPTSSPDPYDSQPFNQNIDTPLPSTIDINALPHGLPVLGPLTGYTPTNLTRVLQARNAYLTQTLSRPLSSEEFTAVAYHTAKGHAIASWGPSLGIAAALYRIRATRAEYRWPFYGKLMSEEAGTGFWDGEKMRVGGKEILANVPTGVKANILHFLRGSAYVTLGMLVVPMVVSSYGSTVTAVGEIRDKRLADVTKELSVVIERGFQDRKEKMGQAREVRIGQTTGQGRTDAGTLYRERRERLEGGRKAGVADDDMSPTGGGVGFEVMDDEQDRLSAGGNMGGMLSDGQMKEMEAKAPQERKNGIRGGFSRTAGTSQTENAEPQASNFGDDFNDDASPTGGRGSDGTGSVWERIRQQSASGPGSTPSPSPSPSSMTGRRSTQQTTQRSTTGDSFTFSGEEQERSYAKDEAQREFDERVEKERRGGDFGGGGSGRRW